MRERPGVVGTGRGRAFDDRGGPAVRGRIAAVARGAAGALLLALAACGGPDAARSPLDDPEVAATSAGRRVEAREGEPFPQVVVAGPPRAMGVRLGALLAEPIRRRLARPLPGAVRDAVRLYAPEVARLLPPAMAEELRGIAAGAGVDAGALLEREVAHEVARWVEPATARLDGAFAAAPGERPAVAVAWSDLGAAVAGTGAEAGEAGWVLVERRPAGRAATLSLGWAGSLGGVVVVAESGAVAAAVEDGTLEPEQRSLRGMPAAAAVRWAVEEGGDAAAMWAEMPRLVGHRAIVADAGNRRLDARRWLVGDDPVASGPAAWVLRPASEGAARREGAARQDAQMGAYAARPGVDQALTLAMAGVGAAAGGPLALLATADGVEVRAAERTWVYAWAR